MALYSTTRRTEDKKRLNDIQRSVLEAYSRGLLTERQAMHQLGLRMAEDLEMMLENANLSPRGMDEVAQRGGSIADGFAHYWRSQNMED